MLHRIIYTCRQAWKYKKILANFTKDRTLQIASIVDLSPQQLYSQGIRAVVVDFDGVLAPHGKIEPIAMARQWLQDCCKIFGPNMVFILSNKPTESRKEYFIKQYSGINFITAKLKKPFPNSIIEIMQITKLLPEEILLIDDRLLTGILAAIISNIRGCLITSPYVDYQQHFYYECIYAMFRKIEQSIFSGK